MELAGAFEGVMDRFETLAIDVVVLVKLASDGWSPHTWQHVTMCRRLEIESKHAALFSPPGCKGWILAALAKLE